MKAIYVEKLEELFEWMYYILEDKPEDPNKEWPDEFVEARANANYELVDEFIDTLWELNIERIVINDKRLKILIGIEDRSRLWQLVNLYQSWLGKFKIPSSLPKPIAEGLKDYYLMGLEIPESKKKKKRKKLPIYEFYHNEAEFSYDLRGWIAEDFIPDNPRKFPSFIPKLYKNMTQNSCGILIYGYPPTIIKSLRQFKKYLKEYEDTIEELLRRCQKCKRCKEYFDTDPDDPEDYCPACVREMKIIERKEKIRKEVKEKIKEVKKDKEKLRELIHGD